MSSKWLPETPQRPHLCLNRMIGCGDHPVTSFARAGHVGRGSVPSVRSWCNDVSTLLFCSACCSASVSDSIFITRPSPALLSPAFQNKTLNMEAFHCSFSSCVTWRAFIMFHALTLNLILRFYISIFRLQQISLSSYCFKSQGCQVCLQKLPGHQLSQSDRQSIIKR